MIMLLPPVRYRLFLLQVRFPAVPAVSINFKPVLRGQKIGVVFHVGIDFPERTQIHYFCPVATQADKMMMVVIRDQFIAGQVVIEGNMANNAGSCECFQIPVDSGQIHWAILFMKHLPDLCSSQQVLG
jgi:hypothetical protein